MNARRIVSLIVIVACAAQAAMALAQQGGAPNRPGVAPNSPPVATVGARSIPKAELDRRTAAAVAEFSQRSGNHELPAEMRDLVRRQVLESLIRLELLSLEAKRQGITSTAAEAEEVLKRDAFFNPGGQFDNTRFLSVKTTQKAAYDGAIAAIQAQLGGRKLNDRLVQRFMPAEGAVRNAASRSMSRVAVEHLSLRRAEFDGNFPEPRESDVLAYYRSHQGDFARPDRANLTVVFVNSPGLTDSARALPGAAEAWTKRMKVTADSLISLVAGGADLGVAAAYLSPRSGIVVQADNFPGYWRGSAAQERRLFDPAMVGRILPEAVPGEEGWMIVRVDDAQPAHVASIREVAREVRGILRRDRKQHADEYAQRALYAQMRDSLAAPGMRVRYAVFDTAMVRVSEPTAADLDRFYRGHLADYSSFDTRSGSIAARPLAEVREDVRARFIRDARLRQTRLAADAVQRAWAAGKRDGAAEATGSVREAVAPVGADLDSTAEGAVVADTVWAHGDPRTGLFGLRGGWIVWQAISRVDRTVPSFPQARGALVEARKRLREAEELEGARRLYDQGAQQFGRGNVLSYTRLIVNPPPMLSVPLTRAEVEKYHRENIDKYSAPELVRARHILIEPRDSSPAADAEASALARTLMSRIRNGEDFSALAKEFSKDIATKDKGGDLGVFGRGTMLDAFERAAFALQTGEMAPEPVRTQIGYHIIQVTEHEPAVVQPLAWIYASVSSDAALAKGERMAGATADSIRRVARTPAEAKRIGERLGYMLVPQQHKIGEFVATTATRPFFEQLEKLKPGQFIAEPYKLKGQGYWLAWVDSIAAPRLPTWDEARPLALEAYRRGAADRALAGKRAELDSLMASGWAFDSLAALWGGPERTRDLAPGKGIAGMSGAATFDSVAFGTANAPELEQGRLSDWLLFPNGSTRMRIVDRTVPSPQQLAERTQNIRAAEVEQKLREYFDDLRKRYPVRILDARMREMQLATPPPELSTP